MKPLTLAVLAYGHCLMAQSFWCRGHVVLEDGSPPPKGVTLTICDTLTTAPGGAFEFRPSGEFGTSGRPCDVTIWLRGFHTYHGYLPLDVHYLRVMLRRVGSEGSPPAQINVRMLACANRSAQAFGKGEQTLGLRDWKAAAIWLRQTVEACPEHSIAWDELGFALEMQGRTDDAMDAYQRASKVEPDFVRPLVHLAGLALAASQEEAALEYSERAVQLKPVGMPRAWYYHCVANWKAGRFAVAEASARRAIEEDRERRFPRAEFALGALLARDGDRDAAVVHLRKFLELSPKDQEAGRARAMMAELEAWR